MGGCLAENERCVVGRTIVITNYSAQDVPALNRANSTGGVMCDRRLLRQALMGAGGVVVVNVRIQDRPQVPLAENQDVVKAFLADGSIMIRHSDRAFFFIRRRLASSLGSFRINKRSYSG